MNEIMYKRLELFCRIEDKVNTLIAQRRRYYRITDNETLINCLNSLYQPVDHGVYMHELLIRKGFVLEDGSADCPRCYKNALISSGAWANLLNGKQNFTKSVLYRIAFTLKLSPEEAEGLISHYGFSFASQDYRDMLVLAMLECKIYDPEDVYEVLERAARSTKNGASPVKNIYPKA